MNKKSLIIVSVAFVAVLLVAAVLYPNLSEKYFRNKVTENHSSDISLQSEVPDTTEKGAEIAADFAVLDSEGKEVKLSDYFGKPVVLNFWATWCDPCRAELPAFDNVYNKYKDRVNFLMINLTDGLRDTKGSVQRFISDNGFSFPVFYDTMSDAAKSYGVYSIPETFFIDKDGSLIDAYIGSMSEEMLTGFIEQILGNNKNEEIGE